MVRKVKAIGRGRMQTLAAGVMLLLLIAVTGFFSSRMVEERARWVKQGVGGFGMGGALLEISRRPLLAFGFRNVLADIVWLQAVQVAGGKVMAPADYDRLYDLLNVTANFDPKFEIPYFLGSLVLGESPVHARKALLVLGRGRQQFPTDWRFPFYIGFTHYFSMDNAAAGGEAMAEAARLPGSPAYLPGLASRMLSEAREPAAALVLLKAIIGQETDPSRRSVLERRIREVTVERDLQMLERAVVRYQGVTGTGPPELADIVREGILPAIPEEPNGGRYMLGKDGKVRSDRVAQRLEVFRKK
jgi:hypothetical protein